MNLNLRAGNSMPLTDRTGAVSGTWNDFQKAVTVEAAAEDNTQVVSYTQWYWVRANAQHVIESVVNSNAMKNNVSLEGFAGGTLDPANTDISYTASLAAAPAERVNVTTYKVVSGSLPAGLTLSRDGSISGTPTEAGDYGFTVEMSGDNWITETASFEMSVANSVTMDDVSAFVLDEDNEIQIGCVLNAEEYDEIIYSVSEGELPVSMQINENGLMYGTPTEEGDCEFTIMVTATRTEDLGFMTSVVTDTLTRTFDLPVVSKAEAEVTGETSGNESSGLNGGVIAALIAAIVLGAGSLGTTLVLNRKKK